jgi:hypothetical protein
MMHGQKNIKTAPTCFGAVTPSLYRSEAVYCRTVQRTHTNKVPLIYAATSPHTDVF